jgi:hypothetical protein
MSTGGLRTSEAVTGYIFEISPGLNRPPKAVTSGATSLSLRASSALRRTCMFLKCFVCFVGSAEFSNRVGLLLGTLRVANTFVEIDAPPDVVPLPRPTGTRSLDCGSSFIDLVGLGRELTETVFEGILGGLETISSDSFGKDRLSSLSFGACVQI